MYKIKKILNRKSLIMILLIAGLSFVLASQTVAADKKWTFHEDKWNDVMAYGTISIPEDSATQWGPWTQFVQPAAGPPAVLPSIPTDGTAYFRPESADEYSPKYSLEEGFCRAGEWCGYALYKNYSKTGEDSVSAESYNGGYHKNYPYAGRIALTLTVNPDQPQAVDEKSLYKKYGHASWRAIGLFGADDPTFTESGDMSAKFYHVEGPDDLGDFKAYTPKDSDGDSEPDGYDEAYAKGDNPWGWGYPDEMTEGFFGRNAGTYGEPGIYSGVNGPFIAGIPTSLTDMSALRANKFEAKYCGWSYLARSHVEMNVQFGPGTWDGTLNGGSDGHVWQSSDGTLHGRIGIRIKEGDGKISGHDFYSNKITADDLGPGGKITGNVLGTFYGKGENAAKAVAGVVDITKTKVVEYPSEVSVSNYSSGYKDGRYVDLFKAKQIVPRD